MTCKHELFNDREEWYECSKFSYYGFDFCKCQPDMECYEEDD